MKGGKSKGRGNGNNPRHPSNPSVRSQSSRAQSHGPSKGKGKGESKGKKGFIRNASPKRRGVPVQLDTEKERQRQVKQRKIRKFRFYAQAEIKEYDSELPAASVGEAPTYTCPIDAKMGRQARKMERLALRRYQRNRKHSRQSGCTDGCKYSNLLHVPRLVLRKLQHEPLSSTLAYFTTDHSSGTMDGA